MYPKKIACRNTGANNQLITALHYVLETNLKCFFLLFTRINIFGSAKYNYVIQGCVSWFNYTCCNNNQILEGILLSSELFVQFLTMVIFLERLNAAFFRWIIARVFLTAVGVSSRLLWLLLVIFSCSLC